MHLHTDLMMSNYKLYSTYFFFKSNQWLDFTSIISNIFYTKIMIRKIDLRYFFLSKLFFKNEWKIKTNQVFELQFQCRTWFFSHGCKRKQDIDKTRVFLHRVKKLLSTTYHLFYKKKEFTFFQMGFRLITL